MHFLGDKNTAINFHTLSLSLSLSLSRERERERVYMLVGESYNLVENVTGDGLVSNVKTMDLAGSIYRGSLDGSQPPMFL